MQETRPSIRFNASIPGILAALLLAATWIASMGAVDSFAYSAAPYLALLCCAVLLWLSGVLRGHKVVRLRPLSWLSLGVGAYYLWRCHNSYSIVEAWGESALILGCFVFYIAGVYAGQGDKCRGIMLAVLLALLGNMVMAAVQHCGYGDTLPLRPVYGVCGRTVPLTALFTYKNFAGFFLMTAGMLPLCRAIIDPQDRRGKLFGILVGLAAIALSFNMSTRSVWLLLPLLVVTLWVLWLVCIIAEDRKIGLTFILASVGIFVAVVNVVYDFLFGHSIISLLQQTDTHLRGMAWKLVCMVAPDGPLQGYGARATQWEIAQMFNDWCAPNLAHNEYLQAWLDYGVIGLSSMAALIFLHLIAGFRQVASEHISTARRAKAAMAMLYLTGSAAYCIFDFGWHQPALAAATAFACGILASPYPAAPWRWRDIGRNWAPDSRPKAAPVRAQGLIGKLLLLLLALGLGCDMAKQCQRLTPAWLASWQFNEMTKKGGADHTARLALLEQVHARYPDAALMDNYLMSPMAYPLDLERIENMLKATLAANPRQAFTAVELVDVLGRQNKFQEAEQLMRRVYNGDGPDSTNTTNWGFYYAYNLIRWGRYKMYSGDMPTALSMLQHGLQISKHGSSIAGTMWRAGDKPWENGWTEELRKETLNAAQSDLKLLQAMGIQPDDSWREPLESGGKPALYLRWKP